MSNTITIQLHEDDRKRIDELIAFAGMIVGEQKQYNAFIMRNLAGVVPTELAPAEEPVAPQETPEQPAPVIEHPVDEVNPYELPEPAAEPEQPKYTKADILAKVQKLAGPNNPKREQAKAVVKSYGAKVSDIPEDKYAEVMEKLTALEG